MEVLARLDRTAFDYVLFVVSRRIVCCPFVAHVNVTRSLDLGFNRYVFDTATLNVVSGQVFV